MSNTNFEQIFEQILETYIKRKLLIEIKSLLKKHLEKEQEKFYKSFLPFLTEDTFKSFAASSSFFDVDNIDFLKMMSDNKSETFSEMLLRLIKESGEKNSTIYTRANIDRRHFSKIANRDDYQPSKQTVLAFVIALKLNFE